MASRSPLKILGLGSTPRMRNKSSKHSSPPSRPEWEWDSRFAVQLLWLTADACGHRRELHVARYFTLVCRLAQVSRILFARLAYERIVTKNRLDCWLSTGLGHLLRAWFGLRFHLRQFAIQLRNCHLERGDFGSGSGQIATGGGDFFLRFACHLCQRLLLKLHIS